MNHSLLDGVLVLLVLSVVAVVLMRRLGLTPILGYLAVGVLAGPQALGWIPDNETVMLLAEVGVVFLLFAIGLEFSLPRLLAMRGIVFGLGTLQVVISTLALGGLMLAQDLDWRGALVVGGALAMSSTAIVVKQLTEQLEMQSRHGRIALGILLFQDLAVVPLLVAIPILAQGGDQQLASPLLIALLKGAIAFALMIATGRWILRPLLHTVAAARSAELFTLTVLLISLAAAWTTHALGLSLALGAFLAGMMLSETEYRHQIETDVRPFRDVLLGLFFITVGAKLDLAALPGVWVEALVLLVALVVGKGLIIGLLTRFYGQEPGVAVRTGLVLAQGGEFGFALLALALNRGLIDGPASQSVLAAVVLSMALTPLLIRYNGLVAKRLFAKTYGRGRATQARQIGRAVREVEGHVILCGFGRMGQNLARILREQGFDYVALDLDPDLIKEAWEAGEPVFYGDSTHGEILAAAGLSRARALVLTVDDMHAAERIVQEVRKRRADLPLLVRAHDDSQLERLERLGATEVVPETLESSMMMGEHLLTQLGVPAEQVVLLMERVRREHYQSLRGLFRGAEGAAGRPELHTVVLQPGYHALGRRLGDLALDELQVTVQALRRSGIRGEAPSPSLVLEEGDALVLQGPPERLLQAEQRLLKG